MTTVALRGLFLLLFALGVAGASGDLRLIQHVGGRVHQIPLFLLGCGVGAAVWLAATPRRAVLRAFQVVMLAFVAGGVLGLWLRHHDRMAAPDRPGFDPLRAAVRGASPSSLAPATLLQLGLLGLAYTYRHPALLSCAGAARRAEGKSRR